MMSDAVEVLSLRVTRSEEEREAVAAELASTRQRLDRCERALILLGQVCETAMTARLDDREGGGRVFIQLLAGLTAVVAPIAIPAYLLDDHLFQ